MCGNDSSFRELDISTCKQVNSFNIKSVVWCVVTHDNKFLITIANEEKFKIGEIFIVTKWSIRTKKLLHTCEIDLVSYVAS